MLFRSKRVVFQLILDGIQHLALRKIRRMVRLQLPDAITELERAKEYSKPKKPTEEEPDLDELVEQTIDLDQGTENDEDDQTSPTKTLFQNAADILDAEENKDQILQLLRKAEINLSAIDYQSADLKKPESKEIIRKILRHLKKLEDVE